VTVSRMDRGARKDAAGTPDMLACGEEMALVQPRFRARHEAVAVKGVSGRQSGTVG
jgi:hypothetical protein